MLNSLRFSWLLTCGPIVPDYERRVTNPRNTAFFGMYCAAETALENRVHLFTFKRIHIPSCQTKTT